MGADLSFPGCCSQCKDGDERGKVAHVDTISIDRSPTTVESEFPTLCMPMSRFRELTLMEPYENVLGILQEPTDMETVHFMSHEWLGFAHPDPEGIQLKRMLEIFQIFADGKAAELFQESDLDGFLKGVSAGTSAQLRTVEGAITTRDLRTPEDLAYHVSSGCVWLDYHSIPQMHKDETFYKAVNGIPAYVERCDYFWICAPTTTHSVLKERRDFASWRRRGWCRLEETTNFLSRNLKMPIVVTDQPKLSTYGFFDGLQLYLGRPERSVFNGSFTCCHFNHRRLCPDGTYEDIACDKETIAPMLRTMFENYISKPTGAQQFRTNLCLSMAQTIFAGCPPDVVGYEPWTPPENDTLEDALARIGFRSLDDKDSMGWGPLVWLMNLAKWDVVRDLIKARPDLLSVMPEEGAPAHGFTLCLRANILTPDRYREFLLLHEPDVRVDMINRASKGLGLTPVDRSAKHGYDENLKTLIEMKSSVEVFRKDNGATPLMSAAGEHYPRCLTILLEQRADIRAVDKTGMTALHYAANPLAPLGNTEPDATMECLTILLEARCDLNARDNKGKTPMDHAQELKMFAEGIDLLTRWNAN